MMPSEPLDPLRSLLCDPSLSVYREHLIEHIFISELVQAGWVRNRMIQVAKSEIDAWGYDVVFSSGNIVRHVQLKSSLQATAITASRALAQINGACIVRVTPAVSKDGRRLELSYRIFQAGPTAPLALENFRPAKTTRYVKGPTGAPVRKDRGGHVTIPMSAFGPRRSVEELIGDIFPG